MNTTGGVRADSPLAVGAGQTGEPLTREGLSAPCPVPLFWDWIDSEAGLIQSDGCSKVSGAKRRQCRAHDLAYYYGRDPADAYWRYRQGDPQFWVHAVAITRGEADRRLRRGTQSDSLFGWFSPLAAWRWVGVRVGAGRAWRRHRERGDAS